MRPEAVSPDRALYLPTFSHFLIVNKTPPSLPLSFFLSLFLPLSLPDPLEAGDRPGRKFRNHGTLRSKPGGRPSLQDLLDHPSSNTHPEARATVTCSYIVGYIVGWHRWPLAGATWYSRHRRYNTTAPLPGHCSETPVSHPTCDIPFPPRRTGRNQKGMISARLS